MLKLKKSARVSKRYLLLKGNKKDVEKTILDYIGVLGWAKAAPTWIIDRKDKNKLILAVNRKEIDNVKASFAVATDKIEVLKISGTLKGLK